MQDTCQCCLRQALADELDIRDSGLWERYRAALDHERRRRQYPPRKDGPISRLHGDRWRAEYLALGKQRDKLAWVVGGDFAAEHGVTRGNAIAEARDAIDDHLTRVRQRYVLVARLLLLGVAVALPDAGEDEPAQEPPAESRRKNTPTPKPAPLAPIEMPVVTMMGAAR